METDVQAVSSPAPAPQGNEAQPVVDQAVSAEPTPEQVRHYLQHGEMPKEEPKAAEPAPANEPEQATESSDEGGDQPEPGPGKPKAKGAEYRKQQLAAEIQELLAQRAQLRAEVQAGKPAEQPKEQPSTPNRPKLEQFPTYEAYEEALTDYLERRAEEKAVAKASEVLTQKEQEQAAARARDEWTQKVKAAKLPDFDEVVYHNPNLTVTTEMATVIQASPLGPQVAYHLGKNPGLAAQLAQLPPLQMARELAHLEVRITGNAPVTAKPQPPAPKPPVLELGVGSAPLDPVAAAVQANDFRAFAAAQDAKERAARGY